MEVGLGILQIPPDQFWRMTVREFWAVYRGRVGRKKPEKPLTMADVREMEKRYLNGHDS